MYIAALRSWRRTMRSCRRTMRRHQTCIHGSCNLEDTTMTTMTDLCFIYKTNYLAKLPTRVANKPAWTDATICRKCCYVCICQTLLCGILFARHVTVRGCTHREDDVNKKHRRSDVPTASASRCSYSVGSLRSQTARAPRRFGFR